MEAAAFSDPAVAEVSRKLIWVWIDRDKTPEWPTFFNVNAYPSLITIGAKKEKIHRFSGFRKAEPFTQELNEALRRAALYKKGEEWDTPDPRPGKICDEGTVATFPAPSSAGPCGLVMLDAKLWIGQRDGLTQVNPASGEVLQTFPIAEGISDLCTDGKVLYAVEHGWTAGLPIHVIDPATGKETGTIVTEANKKYKSYGASGIAWQDGKLAILSGMEGKIDWVDPKNGEIARSLKTDQVWIGGLDFDGTSFVSAGKSSLVFIDPKTGKTTRSVAVNYWVRALACAERSIWMMEQPVMGYDKEHKDVQVWPLKTLVYKLTPPTTK